MEHQKYFYYNSNLFKNKKRKQKHLYSFNRFFNKVIEEAYFNEEKMRKLKEEKKIRLYKIISPEVTEERKSFLKDMSLEKLNNDKLVIIKATLLHKKLYEKVLIDYPHFGLLEKITPSKEPIILYDDLFVYTNGHFKELEKYNVKL